MWRGVDPQISHLRAENCPKDQQSDTAISCACISLFLSKKSLTLYLLLCDLFGIADIAKEQDILPQPEPTELLLRSTAVYVYLHVHREHQAKGLDLAYNVREGMPGTGTNCLVALVGLRQ